MRALPRRATRRRRGPAGLSPIVLALGLLCTATATGELTPLPPYPSAELLDTEAYELGPFRFVLGPVERKSRTVRIANFRDVRATRLAHTYEIPRSVAMADLEAHYREVLSGRLVYDCSGRDCGRSNEWANTVFDRADLYGPDANQRYLAADMGDALASVYLIRRGNQRLYAHVVLAKPETPLALLPAPDDVQALVLSGRFRIEDVRPREDGTFRPEDIERLALLGARLAELGLPPVFVVCHLHGAPRPPPPGERRSRSPELIDRSAAAQALLDASQRCAATAAQALTTSDTQRFLPFGVGPLAPAGSRPRSHLQLILPGGP